MPSHKTAARRAVACSFVIGLMATAAFAGDLSGYRSFPFGAGVSTVAKQAGVDPSDAKTILSRPALVQELDWRPRPLGPSTVAEAVQGVALTFYNGELFRITVTYDTYATEGMTGQDLITSISANYGMPTRPPALDNTEQGPYGDREEALARWQDSLYRFDLIRSSYGPSYRLVGVLKRLEAPAQAATVEAKRLDDLEAPQREAARLASERETATIRLEKARIANKEKFLP